MSDRHVIRLAEVVEELADWVATIASQSDFDNVDEMERNIRQLAKDARNIARDV